MDTKGVGAVGTLLLLGLILGGVGVLPTYEHNVAVQEGQPTTAVVLSTDVEVREDSDGDEEYNPIVVYEYAVDGETYVSENTFPGRFTRWQSSRSWAEGIVATYDPGDEVTVHYDPANPTNAYLRNDGLPLTSAIAGLAWAVVAAIAGVWLVRTGFRRWTQRQLIVNTPTERVRSLSIGRSEIKGTAVPEEHEPFTAPFSDEDCLVAKFEIEQYEEDDDDDTGRWKTIEEGVVHVPFHVDDGTGSVLVEPHDDAIFDLDPDDWSETYVDSSSRGPAPVREFVENRSGLGFPGHAPGKENDRKYRQNLIRPDDSVYVFGNVQPRDVDGTGLPQEDRLVVTYDEDATASVPMFVISDDTEASLVDRRRWALWRGPVGGFFLTAALVSLIAMFGPAVGLALPVLF